MVAVGSSKFIMHQIYFEVCSSRGYMMKKSKQVMWVSRLPSSFHIHTHTHIHSHTCIYIHIHTPWPPFPALLCTLLSCLFNRFLVFCYWIVWWSSNSSYIDCVIIPHLLTDRWMDSRVYILTGMYYSITLIHNTYINSRWKHITQC